MLLLAVSCGSNSKSADPDNETSTTLPSFCASGGARSGDLIGDSFDTTLGWVLFDHAVTLNEPPPETMTAATPLPLAAADAHWFPANPQASEPRAILLFEDTLALVGRVWGDGGQVVMSYVAANDGTPLVGYGQPRMVVGIDPQGALVFDDPCQTGLPKSAVSTVAGRYRALTGTTTTDAQFLTDLASGPGSVEAQVLASINQPAAS